MIYLIYNIDKIYQIYIQWIKRRKKISYKNDWKVITSLKDGCNSEVQFNVGVAKIPMPTGIRG